MTVRHDKKQAAMTRPARRQEEPATNARKYRRAYSTKASCRWDGLSLASLAGVPCGIPDYDKQHGRGENRPQDEDLPDDKPGADLLDEGVAERQCGGGRMRLVRETDRVKRAARLAPGERGGWAADHLIETLLHGMQDRVVASPDDDVLEARQLAEHWNILRWP